MLNYTVQQLLANYFLSDTNLVSQLLLRQISKHRTVNAVIFFNIINFKKTELKI